MKSQLEPKTFSGFWLFFPQQNDVAQMPQREDKPLAEPLPESNTFDLEEYTLEAVDVGHTDTHNTIVLWVKDLKFVVAGDVVYGDVHQYLVEANIKKLRLE